MFFDGSYLFDDDKIGNQYIFENFMKWKYDFLFF